MEQHADFALLLSTVENLSAMGAAELIESLPSAQCQFQSVPRHEQPIGFDVVCKTHNETIHSRREAK